MEWCWWWNGGGAGAGGGQEWWWSGGGGGGVCCCSSSSSSWWWSPTEVEPAAATALHRPDPLLRRSIFVRCLYPNLYGLGYARPAPLARLSKVQDLPSPPFLSCPPLYRPAYLIVPCTVALIRLPVRAFFDSESCTEWCLLYVFPSSARARRSLLVR